MEDLETEKQPLLKGDNSVKTKSKVNEKNKEHKDFQTVIARKPGKLPVFPRGRLRSVAAGDLLIFRPSSPPCRPKVKQFDQNDNVNSAKPTKDCRSRHPVQRKRRTSSLASYFSKPDAPVGQFPPLDPDVLLDKPRDVVNYGAVTATTPSADRQDSDSTSSCSIDVTSTTASDSSAGTFSIRGLSTFQKLLLLNVLLGDYLTSCCLSLLAPFFPTEARSKNVSDSISGWIFGVFSLTQFIFSPICGKLMPVIGGRFMYIAGAFGSGGCTVLFGFLQYVPTENGNTNYLILCFMLRVVLAVGVSALQTAGFAYTFKEFPNSIATVFGIMEVFVGLGFMTGPAVGGLLYGAGGFYLPFAIVGGLILASVPFSYFVLPKLEDPNPVKDDGSVIKLLKKPSIIMMNVVVVIGAVIWSILDPTLEPRLMEFDLSAEIVGLIFLLMSAFYALTAPLWGRVADRMDDNKLLLIAGFLFSSIGLLLLGPSPLFGLGQDYNQLWLNVVSLCLLGMSSSLAIIPSFDVFLDLAETVGFQDNPNTYGVVAGLWSSMYALGDFIGPSIGGVLVTTVGFQMCMTYTAVACACVVVMLAFMKIYEQCKKRSKKVAMEIERYRARPEVKTSHGYNSLHDVLDSYAINPFMRININLP